MAHRRQSGRAAHLLHGAARGDSVAAEPSNAPPARDLIRMARYFFRLTDGNQVLNNHQGIDLAGPAAAREDAVALARDLRTGSLMPGFDWGGWFVAVIDEHGKTVDEVPIGDAAGER